VYRFQLNGQPAVLEEGRNLQEFLRDDVRLTSVKRGCDDSSCGACMVLLNGKAIRACLLQGKDVAGKRVVTIEGLSDREAGIYARAFAQTGAVQCGYCIPGMVISAKALLDANPQPTRQQVKAAIKTNLCRCTGYVKIEDAILAAAKLRLLPDSDAAEETSVGTEWPGGALQERVDAREKILATGQFVDDLEAPGMLYAAVLRSAFPRALVKRIEIAAAQAHAGVEAVLTAKDVPGERLLGHLVHDWPVMIAEGEETRYVGDALALVAARSKAAAREALSLIRVEYEERTPLVTPQQALAEGAPRLHPGGNLLARVALRQGDADKAIAIAAHVVRQVYHTPPTEHAFLEPESALAIPGEGRTLTVYTGGQSVYDEHRGIVAMLGVPGEKVRVISKLVGGAFGGKEDLSVQHHAALLAWHTGQPVKLTLTRRESLLVHPKRHAMEIDITTACDERGRLTAVKALIVSDTGAYASLGGPVLQRACTHAGGPYQIENVEVTGLGAYTNNPPAGAFRGFGVTQSCFAMESNLNLMAAQMGISPWEIRFRNAIVPGGTLPNGQIADESTAMVETLLAVKPFFDAHPTAGIASAFKNAGLGVGVPDVGRVKLVVEDGAVVICTSAACMGQGVATVLTEIVSRAAGVPPEQIRVHAPDTAVTPDGGTSTASRQTLFNGEAARQAALALRADLETSRLRALDGREYYREYHGITDPMDSDKPHRVSHVAYSYATHLVVLDGQGKLALVVAAHDVGRAINRLSLEGQIEGGVVMSLGYALTEDFPLDKGVPTARLGTLGVMRATSVPEIRTIIVEKNRDERAFGAKGIGEISAIPTAPAVAHAYFRRDGEFRTRLPLEGTPYSRKR
jgi:selenium-dependent xanthine dehydrogenase